MNLKEFKDPSALFRPAPFWSWNDKLDKDELVRQIEEMAEKGWGSYFMHSRVGLVTEYLSDEWMELINTCAEAAGRTNTYAWLYDEDKWPSGFAGGEVPLASEDYRSRGLVLIKKGEETELDTVLCEVLNDGKEYSICKRIASLGSAWFNMASYVDLMNPEAVKKFIECTHERYKKACGKHFGKEIPGMFTDEPCYLMYGHYDLPVVQWSDYLPEFFEKANGYKIEDNLEKLFFDIDDYKKVRYDFYYSSTKLFLESFTKQYYKWCDENNLLMTGHFMYEDDMIHQTQWVGCAMPHYEFMHWPGIDKLGRHIEQVVTVKQLSSAAEQLNKERAFCEVFGCVGQQVSFYHRKWITDWQAALGINFVNSHLSLYSMRGERKRDYPANLFYQQAWWDEEKAYADYTGRLSYALTRGKRDIKILVIHTIGSVWSEYTPLNTDTDFYKEKNIYDRPFDELSKALAANNLDFHYGDEMIMEEHAKVADGKFVVGEFAYDAVVVPPCSVLQESTLNLIGEFSKTAGVQKVLAFNAGGLIDEIKGISTEVSNISGVVEALNEIYTDKIQVINRNTGENANEIISHIRIDGAEKIVYLANTDKDKEIKALISIPGAKKAQCVDLSSGECYNLPVTNTESGISFKVAFYPAGSLMITTDSDMQATEDMPKYLDCGVSFAENTQKLTVAKDWSVSMLEENVLAINDVSLYLNGEMVADNEPLAKVWHNHFYSAENGTPFKAEYVFNVEEKPQCEMFAVIENAENLDSITINGNEVKAMKQKGEMGAYDSEKCWKDVTFTKVPLMGYVKEGENILTIEGKKYNNITGPGSHVKVDDFKNFHSTETEVIYIVGDFYVENYDNREFAITAKKEAEPKADLVYDGYPFYAGKVSYKASIYCESAEGKTYIKIDDVNCACIRMKINGKDCGVKCWAPYVFDVSEFVKQGDNEIEIIASATMFNLMGPNRISGTLENEFISPQTFVDINKLEDKYQFTPLKIGKAYFFK